MLPSISEFNYFYEKLINSKDPLIDNNKLEKMITNYHLFQRFSAYYNGQKNLQIIKNKTLIIASNLRQIAFIKKLMSILEAEKIEIILLKSSGLNGYVYSMDKPRGNSDIDLLIREKDRDSFDNLIGKIAKKHTKCLKSPFDNTYEETWISHSDRNLYIDVHTNLANPHIFNIDCDYIFLNSIQHPFYGSGLVRLLNLEMNYLHLGIHIFNDGFLPHHSLIDAALLKKKGEFSEQKLEEQANKLDLKNIKELLDVALSIFFKCKRKKKYHFYNLVFKFVMSKNYGKLTFKRRLQQLFLLIFITRKFKPVFVFIKKYWKNLQVNSIPW